MFFITSKIILANPVITIPATQIPRAKRVGKSLLNFSIGVSLLLMNIAFTTSR